MNTLHAAISFRATAVVYTGGTVAQLLKLYFAFSWTGMPFVIDWLIIFLGSVGASGLIRFHRSIAYRGHWEKPVHWVIVLHLIGSVALHLWTIFQGNHAFYASFPYEYSYFAVLYFGFFAWRSWTIKLTAGNRMAARSRNLAVTRPPVDSNVMFREVVRQEIRLLTFRDYRIDLNRFRNSFLAFAIAASWLAGVGRYWDHPAAYWWQYAGLGSVAYIGVLAIILWLITLPLRPRNWSFSIVFVFVGLTAPPAWLYAIPVERFMSHERSATLNMLFLLFVALWRIALYGVFLRRVAKLSGLAWVSALFLPLVAIVTMLTALNLEHAVFQIMGGLDREPTSADKSYGVIVALSFFSFLLAPILLVFYLVAGYGARKRKNSSNTDASSA